MSFDREHNLLEAIKVLWRKIPYEDQAGVELLFHRYEWSWMLPVGDDPFMDEDWLTPIELAPFLGVTPATIRSWSSRGKIEQRNDGRYNWGEIKALYRRRKQDHGIPDVA